MASSLPPPAAGLGEEKVPETPAEEAVRASEVWVHLLKALNV